MSPRQVQVAKFAGRCRVRRCELSAQLWVPSTGPVGIGISVLSYAGQAVVTLVVDDGLASTSAGLADALDLELSRLIQTGQQRSRAPRPLGRCRGT